MSKSSISEALISEAKRENSQYYSNQDGPGTIVPHVFLLRRHLGMLPWVSVRCQIFNLNPIRKIYDKNDISFFSNKFQKLSPYLSDKSRAKCKW